jgi:integrase/recombinase XerD
MGAAWDENSPRCGIFIATLLLDKKIDHDPTLDIESPEQWKVLPKALARDEMEATLAAPLTTSQRPSATRKEAAALAAPRSRHAGSLLCGRAAGFGDRQARSSKT